MSTDRSSLSWLERFADRRLLHTQAREHPAVIGLIAMALSSISIVLLVWGLNSTDGETFIRSLIWGGLSGAMSLLLCAALMDAWTRGWTRRTIIGGAVVGGGLATTVISVGWFADRTASIYVAPVGLGIAMVGLLFLSDIAATSVARHNTEYLAISMIVTAVAIAVAATTKPSSSGWTGIVAVGTLGLIGAKLSITPWMTTDVLPERSRRTRQRLVLLLSMSGTLVAVLVLGVSNQSWALVVGTWLLVLSLSMGALAALVIDLGGSRWPILEAIAASGFAASVTGLLLLVNLVPAWTTIGWIAFILGSLVGAFFVFNGEGVMTLVLLGALLGWVLVDRVESPVVAENPEGTIVVLGDSFVAGQGAENYLEYTNSQDTGGNMCRRSATSFAYLIAAEFNRTVANYSCSGAKTHEVTGVVDSESPDTRLVSNGQQQLRDLSDGRFRSDLDDVDLVLVSLGGNGAEFSTAVVACFLPSNCTDKSREFLHLATTVEERLVSTYNEIEGTFPDNTPAIVVIPYPSYIGADACGRALDEDEVAFANVFIDTLNSSIRSATKALGDKVLYFDAIDEAYGNHALCDAEPGANLINLLPPAGPILDRLIPTNWHEGSAHPNELGHACTAAVLADWIAERDLLPTVNRAGADFDCEGDRAAAEKLDGRIDDLIDEVSEERGGAEWSTPLPESEGCCDWRENATTAGTECRSDGTCGTVDDWAGARARAVLADLLLPLGLSASGAMLLALFLIRALPTKWLRYFPLVPQQVRDMR